MARLPTWDHVERNCADLIHFTQLIRGDGPKLLDRARLEARDGFPSSSMGNGSGSPSGHGDPTATAALADPLADPVRRAALEVVRHVESARRCLQSAVLAAGSTKPESDAARERRLELEAYVGLPVCANKACEDFAAAKSSGRCRACYVFRWRHDRDPSPTMIAERLRAREAHDVADVIVAAGLPVG